MTKIRIISDIHGQFKHYQNLCSLADYDGMDMTIQLGDFGVGFGRPSPVIDPKHRFMRGNHDDPAQCDSHPNYIRDFTEIITDAGTILCIGGAWSIDHAHRVPYIDWWPDEEISQRRWDEFFENRFPTMKTPDIIITHDAPHFIASEYHVKGMFGFGVIQTTTSVNLQVLWEKLKQRQDRPKKWVFGHWHQNAYVEKDGTEFHCVDQYQAIDFTL